VRIALAIAEPVVPPMRGDPEHERSLRAHRSGDYQETLEPPRGLERLVRDVPVEPNGDPQHVHEVHAGEQDDIGGSELAGPEQVDRHPRTDDRQSHRRKGGKALDPVAGGVELHGRCR